MIHTHTQPRGELHWNNEKITLPTRRAVAPIAAKFCCRRATVGHSSRSPAYRPRGARRHPSGRTCCLSVTQQTSLSCITPRRLRRLHRSTFDFHDAVGLWLSGATCSPSLLALTGSGVRRSSPSGLRPHLSLELDLAKSRRPLSLSLSTLDSRLALAPGGLVNRSVCDVERSAHPDR